MGLRSMIRKTALYQKYKAKREAKMSDEEWFVRRHRGIFGYTPDFRNPQTFNEKIIHRILFDRDPIYTALADKLKARIYIAEMLKDFEDKFRKNETLDSKNKTQNFKTFDLDKAAENGEKSLDSKHLAQNLKNSINLESGENVKNETLDSKNEISTTKSSIFTQKSEAQNKIFATNNMVENRAENIALDLKNRISVPLFSAENTHGGGGANP